MYVIDNKHQDIYPAIDPSDPSSSLANSAEGRTIIITGAGRGIGRAIALYSAKAKASIIILASRTTTEIHAVAEEITAIDASVKVVTQACDVSDEESVKALIAAAVQASPEHAVYTLINNAGYLHPNAPIGAGSPAEWWKTWEINVKGTYLPTHFLIPHLDPNTPKPHYIINISSHGSREIKPGANAYQTSKIAVNRFTEFLHIEHAQSHNLCTFAVHPGGVKTTLTALVPEKWQGLLADTPELMGGFAVWLASGKADWASGRYLEANWDVDEILAMKDKVEGTSIWKTVVDV